MHASWVALGRCAGNCPTTMHAETLVRGTSQYVVVEAQNASVQEILITLTNAFDIQFKSSADLNKQLTGTYKGTLQQTLSRILEGYDLVMNSDQAGLKITLLGTRRSVAAVGAPPAQTVATRDASTIPQGGATADSRASPIGFASAPPPMSTRSPDGSFRIVDRFRAPLKGRP
jgi:hypothetical protein